MKGKLDRNAILGMRAYGRICGDFSDGVACHIADYNVKDKEVDTMLLKRWTMVKLDEARSRFKFLQRVIDL